MTACVLIPEFGLQSQGLALGPPHTLRAESAVSWEPSSQFVLGVSKRQLVRLIPDKRELQVLDARSGEVRVRLRLDAGAFGITKPTALAFDGKQRMIVADQVSSSLAEFAIAHDRVRFISRNTVPLSAMLGVCIVKDIAIVSALRDPVSSSDLMHFVSPSGEVRGSMLSQGDRAGSIANALFELRRIFCDNTSGVVFSAARNTEAVSAHRVSGERLWAQQLPDYRRLRVNLGAARGSPSPAMIDSVYDQTDGVFEVGDSILVVQVARRRAGRKSRVIARRTFTLDARTGQILQRFDSLPAIVGVGRNVLYFADSGTTSTLRVRSVRTVRLK